MASTLYVGNLDTKVTEELLYELFIQVSPVANVYLPKDRVSNVHQGYGFIDFSSKRDAEYASQVMAQVKLYGQQLRISKADGANPSRVKIGAQLFVGGLDPLVDEKLLDTTFSAFGPLSDASRVVRDSEGVSRGHAFLSFRSFEDADRAISNMDGHYLMNKPCTVSYARKDGSGTKHGGSVERLLAESALKEERPKREKKRRRN